MWNRRDLPVGVEQELPAWIRSATGRWYLCLILYWVTSCCYLKGKKKEKLWGNYHTMVFAHYSWVILGMSPDMNQSSPEKRCQKIHPKSFPPFLIQLWLRPMLAIFANKGYFRGKVIRIHVFSLPERGAGSFILLSTFLSYQEFPALSLQTFSSALSVL